MFKKYSKFHECIQSSFSIVKAVKELFDNPLYHVRAKISVLVNLF